MYTATDISAELEQRVNQTNLLLIDAIKWRPREMRILPSMRAEEIIKQYEAIIRDLPITRQEKYSFGFGDGQVYLFKGDERNARTLIEIAFGHGVARGAYSIFPPEQRDDFETLERKAFAIKPGYNNRALTAWIVPGCIPIVTPPADLTGTGIRTYILSPDFPPRISVNALREYGKYLGFNLNDAYVKSVFERIQTWELPGSGNKETWLTVTGLEPEQPSVKQQSQVHLPKRYRKGTQRDDLTKDVLSELVAKRMSVDEIAQHLHASYQVVSSRLKSFDLKAQRKYQRR